MALVGCGVRAEEQKVRRDLTDESGGTGRDSLASGSVERAYAAASLPQEGKCHTNAGGIFVCKTFTAPCQHYVYRYPLGIGTVSGVDER